MYGGFYMREKQVVKKVVWSLVIALVVGVCCKASMVLAKANEVEYDEDMMRGGHSRRAARTVTAAEYRLFASIVYCEAGGEKYEGQLGVANVILNRVDGEGWPNTLYDVIYQKGQFSPVKNGYLNRVLAEYDQGKFNSDKWHQSVLKAVDDALAGKNNIGNSKQGKF